MVALETPPCHSPGVPRTANFARTLPSLGWLPVVLSARESIYEYLDREAAALWPPEVEIVRAFGLDSSRHLAIRRQYWSGTATPDKYLTWLIPAVAKGLQLIRMQRPQLIWSTYPVATSHWVASILARRSGLPWVADFRDPAQFHYDSELPISKLAAYVDRRTVEQANCLVFTTERSRALYRKQYPTLESERTTVIENGYDEALYESIVASHVRVPPASNGHVRLLHSGALYGQGRDPTSLIRAVELVHQRLSTQGRKVTLSFRGITPFTAQQGLITNAGAKPYVESLPRLSFRQAFAEMFTSTVLVLLQQELFDHQVPGKAYEYIASGRPIVAVTSETGATADLLRRVGSTLVVPDGDVGAIAEAIERAIELPERGGDISPYSRSAGSHSLAKIFNAITDSRSDG